MIDFDWCHFCAHDDNHYPNCEICTVCTERPFDTPSAFEEKISVTAYRKAIEGAEE